MKENMQKQEQDKKKKRKILLACLIPVGAAAVATAITLPIVLTKKSGQDKKPEGDVDFVLNSNGSYYTTGKSVTFEQNKSYTVQINFVGLTDVFNFLLPGELGGQASGFSKEVGTYSATLNGSPTTIVIDGGEATDPGNSIGIPAAAGATGTFILHFKWIGATSTGPQLVLWGA